MTHPQDIIKLWIVVADDDLEYHGLVNEVAKECELNHLVSSVFNGRQLLDLLLKKGVYKTEYYRNPDAIILDLEMKVEGGDVALEIIKSTPSLKKIPIYIITKKTSALDKKNASELGVKAVIEKPVDTNGMRKIVYKICGSINEN
jgi:two-component system, response regulator